MFIFFGACLADGVVTTYLDLSLQYPKQPTRDTILYTALIGLCMVIVGSYWMYQWYKQKAYFYADEING
jgi:hypothetical protein